MANGTQRSRTVPVPVEIQSYATALVRELGPRQAAERLGVSRQAALSLAVGATVERGTLALAREAMRRPAA
jgi:hypothetical protein